MSNNASRNENAQPEAVREQQARKFRGASVLAIAAILVIVAGSAYGLANGTIFQHRDEALTECGGGSCGDCEDGANPYLNSTASAAKDETQAAQAERQEEWDESGALRQQPTVVSPGACTDCEE